MKYLQQEKLSASGMGRRNLIYKRRRPAFGLFGAREPKAISIYFMPNARL